jgi:hypothetical protein
MRARLALLAVAAVVPAADAGAVPTSIEYARTTQAPNDSAQVTARCPYGRRWVVGGGHVVFPAYDPVLMTGAQTMVQRSAPRTFRKWTVESFAIAGGTDSSLFAVAVCRREKVKQRSNTYPIAAATDQTTPSKCPTSWHVIGGGYEVVSPYDPQTASGANVSIHSSRRIRQQQWHVGAIRDYGNDAEVVAHSICERDIRSPVRFVRESASVEDIGRHRVIARCFADWKAVSGGFEVRPVGTPGSSLSTGLPPWVSINAPLPRRLGWGATLHTATPTPGATLDVWAYCKPD